jgi:hypothetical protein
MWLPAPEKCLAKLCWAVAARAGNVSLQECGASFLPMQRQQQHEVCQQAAVCCCSSHKGFPVTARVRCFVLTYAEAAAARGLPAGCSVLLLFAQNITSYCKSAVLRICQRRGSTHICYVSSQRVSQLLFEQAYKSGMSEKSFLVPFLPTVIRSGFQAKPTKPS